VVSTRFTLAEETDKAEKFAATTAERKTAGIVLDDDAAEYTGAWKVSDKHTPLVGSALYRHDDRAKKSDAVAKFTPEIPADGRYEVRLLYVRPPIVRKRAQITIRSADGEKVVTQNQREACLEDGIPRSLGVFTFAKGKSASDRNLKRGRRRSMSSSMGCNSFLRRRPRQSAIHALMLVSPSRQVRGCAGENPAADAVAECSETARGRWQVL
jgi:hypothetical protein